MKVRGHPSWCALPKPHRGGCENDPHDEPIMPGDYHYYETPRDESLCGAWAGNGTCTLPKGHNMGKVDIPANHARPDWRTAQEADRG